jgi:hypothetical protein
MKTLITWAFLGLTILSTASTQGQTVDEIVNKHIDAMGGKAMLTSIKTVYKESSVDVMGNEAPSITYIINGKAYRNELDFGGQKIIQCVTDKAGWSVNPMAGQTTPTAMTEDLVKASQPQLEVGGPLLDYAAKGYKVEMIGKDTAGGLTYKLRLTTKEGMVMTFYIDSKTWYITKSVNKVNAGGQEMETEVTFSDYKKTDNGYVMSYSQSITLPQVTLNITHKKIEVNKEIDPAIFAMPKS